MLAKQKKNVSPRTRVAVYCGFFAWKTDGKSQAGYRSFRERREDGSGDAGDIWAMSRMDPTPRSPASLPHHLAKITKTEHDK